MSKREELTLTQRESQVTMVTKMTLNNLRLRLNPSLGEAIESEKEAKREGASNLKQHLLLIRSGLSKQI
jgi:hypothetical protein